MKVLVAQQIPTVGIDLLKHQHYNVEESDHTLSKKELIKAIHDKDALICATHEIDAEIIEAGKNLKIISKLAVGFDNIDIKFAGQCGIKVTNAPGVLTQTVAEFAFAHILALARKVVEADQYVREGKFEKWCFDLMVGSEIRGKIIGIIGFGSIGQCLVPMAKGFGMETIYTNQRGELEKFKNDPSVQFVTKNELLSKADFVVIFVPLTNDTKHMITYKELSMMKPSAFLINMARGPIVKEKDLIQALKEKKIAGAGLDVYEFEPAISQELFFMRNTVLTPHIGAATAEAHASLSLKAAQNVIMVLEGKECENVVNEQYLR